MSDNVAVLEGFTRQIVARKPNQPELHLLVKPDTILEDMFRAWNMDQQEFIRVDPFQLTIEDAMLEWNELWDAMKANYATDPLTTKWALTTEAMFYNQLEVLPPQRMGNGSFLVGEPWDHNAAGEAVYCCFMESNGKYYARYMTTKNWDRIFVQRREMNEAYSLKAMS